MKAKSLSPHFIAGLKIYRVIGKWRTFQRRRTHRQYASTPEQWNSCFRVLSFFFSFFFHFRPLPASAASPEFRVASWTVRYNDAVRDATFILLTSIIVAALCEHGRLYDSGLPVKRKEIVRVALSPFRWILDFGVHVTAHFVWNDGNETNKAQWVSHTSPRLQFKWYCILCDTVIVSWFIWIIITFIRCRCDPCN